MLAEATATTIGQTIKPRSFSALMDLYEHNYLRMRKIAPDLDIADRMVSVSAGHLDLYLDVEERCKYTTMLRMTYRFHDQEQDREILQPDIHIRIYHDAMIAEADNRLDRHSQRIYSGETLQQKWNLNRFLYKWVGYCLHQGHCFHPVSNLKRINQA
jgi:hypothetical protein